MDTDAVHPPPVPSGSDGSECQPAPRRTALVRRRDVALRFPSSHLQSTARLKSKAEFCPPLLVVRTNTVVGLLSSWSTLAYPLKIPTPDPIGSVVARNTHLLTSWLNSTV